MRLTNEKRALVGSAALTRNLAQEACADREAQVESAANASGQAPHSSWGSCGERGQNLCGGAGWGMLELTEHCVVTAWFGEGPGTGMAHAHYNQLVNTAFTGVACGFYFSSSGDLQVVQIFY